MLNKSVKESNCENGVFLKIVLNEGLRLKEKYRHLIFFHIRVEIFNQSMGGTEWNRFIVPARQGAYCIAWRIDSLESELEFFKSLWGLGTEEE
jgi:hypothetical protein